MEKYNVFNGWGGLITFILMMLSLILHYSEDINSHDEQIQKIEQLSNKIDSLKCSVDSLENILYD